MNLLEAFFNDFVDFLDGGPPPPSETDAVAWIEGELVLNSITTAQAQQWLDDVVAYCSTIGWSSANTYTQLRSKVTNDTVAAKAFFSGISQFMVRTFTNADSQAVTRAIVRLDYEGQGAVVDADIATITAARDAETDPVLIASHNAGLAQKQEERNRIDIRIAGNS